MLSVPSAPNYCDFPGIFTHTNAAPLLPALSGPFHPLGVEFGVHSPTRAQDRASGPEAAVLEDFIDESQLAVQGSLVKRKDGGKPL